MSHGSLLRLKRRSPRTVVTRRAFIEALGQATAALSAAGLLGACTEPDSPPADSGGKDTEIPSWLELPTLGGAPATEDGWCVAAFVDTVVPGMHRDPDGAVGAIDVGAAGLFFDPSLPAASFVGFLRFILDATSESEHQVQSFARCTPNQREEVVARCSEETSLFAFAIQLAKLAYFASEGAGLHLGYPGANAGYVGHPDFGFGSVALSSEMTPDGNLP